VDERKSPRSSYHSVITVIVRPEHTLVLSSFCHDKAEQHQQPAVVVSVAKSTSCTRNSSSSFNGRRDHHHVEPLSNIFFLVLFGHDLIIQILTHLKSTAPRQAGQYPGLVPDSRIRHGRCRRRRRHRRLGACILTGERLNDDCATT
jgi:hypothetical protein